MKVLIINSDFGFGSTGKIVCDLAKMLIKKGDECCIAYGRDYVVDGSSEIGSYKIGNHFGVSLHALFSRITDRQGFYSKHATKKLIEFIKKYRPDLIHLHNLHGYYINITIFLNFLSETHIPVIWTLHDCWAFTGHCSYFTYVKCEAWKTLCKHCPQKFSYPTSFLFDSSERNYKEKKNLITQLNQLTITTVSKWLMQEVQSSFLKCHPIVHIPNGIDLKIFKPVATGMLRARLGITDQQSVVLCVASIWNQRKGFDIVVGLSNIIDYTKYALIVIGVNQQQERLLNSQVIAIPRTNSKKQLVEYYSLADVFVNTSREETFGLVSLEALACGTPVITNRCTANPELVFSDCGEIVEHVDSESYYSAIQKVISMQISANQCGKHVLQYEMNMVYEQYYSLFLKSIRETKTFAKQK